MMRMKLRPELMSEPAVMSLKTLMEDQSLADIKITGVSVDSRKVKPGFLFAAFKGDKFDGVRYIPDAVAQGAVAILVEQDAVVLPCDVPVIRTYNLRRAFARAAARFYKYAPENLVAVTGTNGKSSVVDLFRQMAGHCGHKSACIGTIGLNVDGDAKSFGLTTPAPDEFHKMLAELHGLDVTHAAFEASSHGLEQYRVDGVKIKAAAFTNLSRDHLDYHHTLEDYLFAKLRLFGEVLPPQGIAVINADDDYAHEVETLCWVRGIDVLSVGEKGEDIHLLSKEVVAHGQKLHLGIAGQVFELVLPLIGDFQASNALVAAGLLLALGEKPQAIVDAMQQVSGVHGRLEEIGVSRRGARIIIDYAHTPGGLEAALKALKPHNLGRMHVVFGCGGDRDKGKRPEMGRVATEHADRVYVTDDNPRSEDAALIRAQILYAAPQAMEIGDRAEAITAAVSAAGPGDIVLIAGKGHETGQIVGDQILPFSDIDAAKAALSREGGVE